MSSVDERMFILTCVDCADNNVSILKIVHENNVAVSALCDYMRERKKSNPHMLHELLERNEIVEYIRYHGMFFNEKRMIRRYKIIEVDAGLTEIDCSASAYDVYENYTAGIRNMPELDRSELMGANGKPSPAIDIPKPVGKAKIVRNL